MHPNHFVSAWNPCLTPTSEGAEVYIGSELFSFQSMVACSTTEVAQGKALLEEAGHLPEPRRQRGGRGKESTMLYQLTPPVTLPFRPGLAVQQHFAPALVSQDHAYFLRQNIHSSSVRVVNVLSVPALPQISNPKI